MNDEPKDPLQASEAGDEHNAADGSTVTEEIVLAQEIAKLTPSNDELLKRAKKHPPPADWFEQDEERPF